MNQIKLHTKFWKVLREVTQTFPMENVFSFTKCYGHVLHLCWKNASRALQMVYLSWSVRRCSSCWLKVRPCTRILGGRISATHCRELSTGARERGETSTCSGSGMVKAGEPSSTTRLGIAPLPCSIDTTFSCEQLLRRCTKIWHRVLIYRIMSIQRDSISSQKVFTYFRGTFSDLPDLILMFRGLFKSK